MDDDIIKLKEEAEKTQELHYLLQRGIFIRAVMLRTALMDLPFVLKEMPSLIW